MKLIFVLGILLMNPDLNHTFRDNKLMVTQQEGLSESEFRQLKIDYGTMTKSPNYRLMRKNMREFAAKMGSPVYFKDDAQWQEWISNNLEKTKFTTIDEANNLKEEGYRLTKLNQEEFSSIYVRMGKASRKQVLEILNAENAGEFE